ncbi:hypothetical protein PSA01_31500 [Pseudonocardia saturnea]|uniref:TrbL/VirB6 plasmid conjugal transfer protein n=1 Tax=Pseudonocardia saturnea TaxID=33909 RepID=A0ABQ0RZP7_9PSEU|nr:hypothetical protein Pdca_40110 [Pseudonocardia autotrophica]GEC26121.1 hypothetical protein PSA01_31500 [Pseudonocardia saturnea]
MFDVAGCIGEAFTGLLRAAVTDVVNPALELLSDTLLSTPLPSTIPRLTELWGVSWRIALAAYTALVLAGGLLVMVHQSVQTRYGVREVAPRLVVGFVAAWWSLPLADTGVQIANSLSGELVGGVDERAGMAGLAALVRAAITSPPAVAGVAASWPLLLASAVVGVLLVAVLAGWVLRVVMVIVLVAGAPLVVMWHALPQTDPLARWWWRAMTGLLSIQVLQALIVSVGLVVLLPDPDSPDGTAGAAGVFGLPSGQASWVTLLVLGVLLWLLLRVPGWVWSTVKLRAGGSSLLATAIKIGFAVKGARLLGAGLGGGAVAASTRRRLPGGWGDVCDPLDRAPMLPSGQLALPLPGLRPRRATRRATPVPPPGEGRRPGPGQLALPLTEGVWPEHRAVAGRDGQWRLPIDVARVPRTTDTPTPTVAVGAGRSPGRGEQLRFPGDGLWPEQRAVAGADGQYRFAFPVARRPSPPRSGGRAGSGRPAVASFGGRQVPLNLRPPDPYRGVRALRSGQYPLPLPNLHRTPRPAPPAPAPRPDAARPASGGVQLRLPIPAGPTQSSAVAPRPAAPGAPPRTPTPRTPPPTPPPPSTPPVAPRPATSPSPSPSPSPDRAAPRVPSAPMPRVRPRRAPRLPMRKDPR